MDSERLVGDHRCWPCTAVNSAVGLVIAWLPSAAMLVAGNRGVLPAAAAWGVVITAYSTYRLVRQGYLPLAERVAKGTGLHDRFGPETRSGENDRPAARETVEAQDDSTEFE